MCKPFWMLMPMLLRLLLWLISWKGGDALMALVDLYVCLIINGRRTFDQVPTTLQPAVQAELEALGLGTDGQPLS
ncbi:CD1375 family protein [Brevibacillus aydinogluensis]